MSETNFDKLEIDGRVYTKRQYITCDGHGWVRDVGGYTSNPEARHRAEVNAEMKALLDEIDRLRALVVES